MPQNSRSKPSLNKMARASGIPAVSMSPRMSAFLAGEITVHDLDMEELTRGQFKDKNGKFTGRPPEMVPRQFHVAILRELGARMQQRFNEHALEAVDTMVEIMREGEGAEETEFDNNGRPIGKTKGGTQRFKAAQYIVERVMGPIMREMHISVEASPWQKAIEGGELIVDADVIDEEDLPLVSEYNTARPVQDVRPRVRRR